MGSAFDLIELSRQLKQERLFINCERDQLHQLNSEVCKTAESLYCLSWVTRQQKANLSDLVRAARKVTPVACCQKANALEAVKFVDGYKTLTYHEAKIGECLNVLRADPELVAMVLMQAEKEGSERLQYVAHVIMSGVYGNTVMQEDESLVLQILKSLIELQLAVHENPRKLLRKESSAFGVFFKLFIEGLFSARLFLTAALHKPVMQLLMEDEWFYDIDPQRALHRFPPDERKRRFGSPETAEYVQKTEHYRNLTATKLVTIADRFIVSIKNNMYCFPQSLCWLVSQLYSIVTSRGHVTPTEARAMCADLVLALFICPAICDPEPLGITSDAPISYIARHNLMQVAQILQVLAISTPTGADPRQQDLYGKFEKECMTFLLSGLLDAASGEQPPQGGNNSQMIQRTAMYMTMAELRGLLRELRQVVEIMGDESAVKERLCALLSSLPSDTKLEEMQSKHTPNTTPHGTPPGTPSAKKMKAKDRQARLRSLLTADRHENGYQSDPEVERNEGDTEQVILVSLGVVNECPGMESEQKIIEQENRQKKSRYNSLVPGEDDPISESEILANEKRTRFSLSHDQDSIATSDNLEAISEAASSHSVGSDIENDNLSDMVSANVSGRGTPSISGRDTPLSQATCETDSQVEGQVEERRAGPDLPVTVHKNNREDVTDKFQKFEIEREEIKSTVSDTWSTDVLASDSEPPEQNQMERLDEIAEEMVRQNLLGVQMQEACEALETASDAWSTDVLASDTSELQVERLLELEQEEVSSVSSRSQLQDEVDAVQEEVSSVSSRSQLQDEGEAAAAANASEDTPQPSSPHSSISEDRRISGDFGGDSAASAMGDISAEMDDAIAETIDVRDPFSSYSSNETMKIASDRYSEPSLSSLGGSDPLRREKKSKRGAAQNNPQSSGDTNLDVGKNTFVHSSEGVFRQVGGQSEDASADAAAVRAAGKPILAWEEGSQSLAEGDSASMKGSENSVDSIASQLSTGLKLTEQQNVNIDAKRLSSVVTVFDPLAPPTADSPVNQHDWSQSESRKLPLAVSGKQTAHNRSSYAEQGARPKIVLNSQNNAPRIQLQPSESRESSRTSQQVSRGSSQGVRFDPSVGESVSVSVGTESVSKCKPEDGLLISLDETVPGLASAAPRSRSLTDGMSSSAEVVSAGSVPSEATPQVTAAEASPARAENHFLDEKTGADKKKSYGSSIFKSFKEKLSKGKQRKAVKSHDKEERGVAVLLELDKGSAGDAGGARNGHESRDYTLAKAKSSEDSTVTETTDDILAKYRRPASSSPRKTSDVMEGRGDADDVDRGGARGGRGADEEQPQPPAYDPTNLENCKAFLDAKKKLRLVLSTADFQAIPLSGSSGGVLGSSPLTVGGEKKENELVSFLKAQLAEAINLQDKDLIARLHETIRCLTVFSNYETKKLLKSIREEHRSRSPYTSYLIRCRQGLLGTQAHLERLLNRVQRDKTIVNKYFLSVNVRMFLEKREQDLVRFMKNFQDQAPSDEKTEFVEAFLRKLHADMNSDPVWQTARREQVEEAKVYIERNVMSHIYTHAMYPNGDGDMARDQILYEHMKKLAQVITPNHKDLRIPRMYHYECPWPAAQNEIYMINAYKTPKDKLQCVLRCSSTIMNLLSLANEKSVPAADDFMPVLIFVLIKANPPSLLSTVQYVNSFYEQRLHGEEQYWWMQFTSAIVFIKNMDYGS